MFPRYTILLILGLGALGTFANEDIDEFPLCPTCFYNMLTMNWPESVCKLQDNQPSPKSCRSDLASEFTIHGLWPQLSQLASMISYCKNNKEKFNLEQLSAVSNALNTSWPSAFDRNGASFWKHEWDKHGTCTSFTMSEYFHESLRLYKKFPLTKWLREGDIVPDNDRPYSVAHIQAVLERHMKKENFVLKCQTHNRTKQMLLNEIWVCVKYSNVNHGNPCSHVHSTCSGNVYLIKSRK